jgi:hypothetical protein
MSSGIVWIASYPKSGSTWLRLALESLSHGGAPIALNQEAGRARLGSSRDIMEDVLGVDTSDLSAAEIEALRPVCYETLAREAGRMVMLKVHDAWTLTASGVPLFPPAVTRGALYLVRDPRDVAVSNAHHESISFDRQIERMAMADYRATVSVTALRRQVPQRFLSWSGHVESWLDAPGLRLLVVRYEDMLRDLAGELARIAAFLDMPASAEAIAGAVAATRFEDLRAVEAAESFIERPPRAARFFRKGKAGSWCEELSAEQAARVTHTHGRVMRRLGYQTERVCS